MRPASARSAAAMMAWGAPKEKPTSPTCRHASPGRSSRARSEAATVEVVAPVESWISRHSGISGTSAAWPVDATARANRTR